MKVIVILIYRGQLKFRKWRRQLTTGNIAHGKSQKRQNCVSVIFRQQICNAKYDSVDIATTIVKRSFSKHLYWQKWFSKNRIFSKKASSKRCHRTLPETASAICRGHHYSWSKVFLNSTSLQKLLSTARRSPGGCTGTSALRLLHFQFQHSTFSQVVHEAETWPRSS